MSKRKSTSARQSKAFHKQRKAKARAQHQSVYGNWKYRHATPVAVRPIVHVHTSARPSLTAEMMLYLFDRDTRLSRLNFSMGGRR